MINKFLNWLEVGSRGSHPEHADFSQAQSWTLDHPLFHFPGGYPFTIRQAREGIHVTGRSGSGKTSGPGKTIAYSYLRNGFGMLVLCSKVDEAPTWREWLKETNRTDDLVEFGSVEGEFFNALNFLDYELNRKGDGAGETENILNLFLAIAEVAERKNGKAANADFFQRAMKVMLRNAIELLKLSRGKVSLLEIAQIVSSAPQNLEEANSKSWQESVCAKYLTDAEQKTKASQDADRQYELNMVASYWLTEFPSMPDRQRSGFVETFRGMADGFLRGKVRKLFCGETTITPEALQQGKIILINLPVREHGEVGKFANCLWFYLTMKSLERRPDSGQENARPVSIWADESHNFIMNYCQQFLTSARSSQACTVFMTQNIPNYIAELGENSKSEVDSLLGNLNTKIFCNNGDTVTNAWASEVISKTKKWVANSGYSSGAQSSSSSGRSETMEYSVPPGKFASLRTGGPENDFKVDAYVHISGRNFGTAQKPRNYLATTFNQRISS